MRNLVTSFPEAIKHHIWDNQKLDDVGFERVYAAREQVSRSKLLEERGWIERVWRPTSPGSPPVLLQRERKWSQWSKLITGWMDHPYRLVNKSGGRVIFVSEPYGLWGEALKNLSKIQESGYMVRIDAVYALHFPGETVAIHIEKEHNAL